MTGTVTKQDIQHPSFWDHLKTEALNAWHSLEADLEPTAERIKATVQADLPIVAKQLGSLAVQLVIAFATAAFDSLTGGAKFSLASQALLATAKSQAIDLAAEDAGAAVQQAYDALSVTHPKIAPPASVGDKVTTAIEQATAPAATPKESPTPKPDDAGASVTPAAEAPVPDASHPPPAAPAAGASDKTLATHTGAVVE